MGTHAELDILLDSVLSTAHRILRQQGHFYPFGAEMSSDGRVVHVDADDGSDLELPCPEEATESLIERFRRHATSRQITAAATCVDTGTLQHRRGGPNAIHVLLEHISGASVQVDQPYRKRLLRSPQYDEALSTPSTPRIFVSDGEPSSTVRHTWPDYLHVPPQLEIRAYLESIPRSARRALRAKAICSIFSPFSVIVCWGVATVVAMLASSPGARSIGTSASSTWIFFWIFFGLALGLAVGFVLTYALGAQALHQYLTRSFPDGHLPYCPACRHDVRGSRSSECPECGCPVVIPPGA